MLACLPQTDLKRKPMVPPPPAAAADTHSWASKERYPKEKEKRVGITPLSAQTQLNTTKKEFEALIYLFIYLYFGSGIWHAWFCPD